MYLSGPTSLHIHAGSHAHCSNRPAHGDFTVGTIRRQNQNTGLENSEVGVVGCRSSAKRGGEPCSIDR